MDTLSRSFIAIALTATTMLASTGSQAADPSCDMQLAFLQIDKGASKSVTQVWSDSSGDLMFVDRLNVNTDGTRRSYSVEDFWGEQTALNNLCNAMSDACAGLDSGGLKARRIATQAAAAAGWPRDQLAATRISPDIIPMPNAKPCPEIQGFLVSATALHKPAIRDSCDLSNYVDALATPAIVIPKDPKGAPSEFSKRDARVGDLVAAVKVGSASPVLGVVGDAGPVDSLGEASIAMNGRLLGKTSLPANYLEVRGRPPFRGKGWAAPKTFVLIFSGSKNATDPFMTVDRIEPEARSRFEAWGGMPRANACIKAYLAANP